MSSEGHQKPKCTFGIDNNYIKEIFTLCSSNVAGAIENISDGLPEDVKAEFKHKAGK